MEDRLDDAIHVLRNHAEPVALSSRAVDTSLRSLQPTSHSTQRLLSSANGLTFPASLSAVSSFVVVFLFSTVLHINLGCACMQYFYRSH